MAKEGTQTVGFKTGINMLVEAIAAQNYRGPLPTHPESFIAFTSTDTRNPKRIVVQLLASRGFKIADLTAFDRDGKPVDNCLEISGSKEAAKILTAVERSLEYSTLELAFNPKLAAGRPPNLFNPRWADQETLQRIDNLFLVRLPESPGWKYMMLGMDQRGFSELKEKISEVSEEDCITPKEMRVILRQPVDRAIGAHLQGQLL
ncbi:hypothetical protein HY439_00595 [Candidatus Microgenomates bacterium]|nr:hypothetical protein [Candidatus Microgenomates bacterium]